MHPSDQSLAVGRLTLVEDLGMHFPRPTSKQKARYGLFKCACGNPDLLRIQVRNVKKGNTTSCGKCRFYEDPDNYGEVITKCETCGAPIKTSKNRIRAGRGRFCSQQCMFDMREIEANKRNIGFKHPNGFLTVLSFSRHPTRRSNKGKTPVVIALCKCDCGRIHSTDWISIQHGRCLRCEVCNRENHSRNSSKFEQLQDKRFGRLVVVGYKYIPGNNGADSHYLCDCDCGTKGHPVKSAYALESGHTTSCGCWEGSGRDTYQGFKGSRAHRESACEFYFVEVAGGPLQKFGISVDTVKIRGIKSYGNYTKYYRLAKGLNRAKCWVIEQVMLYETLENFPTKNDIDAAGIGEGWLGGTELRIGLDIDQCCKRIDFLVEQACLKSWRGLYEQFVTGHQRDLRKQQLRKAIAAGLLEDHSKMQIE
ncbi:hypothetical protein [Synechococcus sp. RS9916]|uniref:hypothetical protein n=1 Tax=Synechococcus sp. RS9916 TaxID=221359 RepID=UPI0002E7CD34|nr:hypothetical protein [Synechococcus sp. RS9916]